MTASHNFSIILPAKNEADSLQILLPKLANKYPHAEIIVVNDGSTDNTISICEEHNIACISHPYSMGNGSAIKTGSRHASGDTLIFMDADSQHNPEMVDTLIKKFEQGFDMVVGARDHLSHASKARLVANTIYNRLSSWMVGHKIKDLTSGLRMVDAEKFREFLHLLPNKFSYPTTITMAFFRAGYSVAYCDIRASKRIGKSHIKPLQDGIRFLLIIFKIGTLYSPLKIFIPISTFFFFAGIGNYIYTFVSTGHFTNMSALLLSTSVIIFLIGLVSEQITNLFYKKDI